MLEYHQGRARTIRTSYGNKVRYAIQEWVPSDGPERHDGTWEYAETQ